MSAGGTPQPSSPFAGFFQGAKPQNLNMTPTPQVSSNPFADFFKALIPKIIQQYAGNAANNLALPVTTTIQQANQAFGNKGPSQDQLEASTLAAENSPVNPMAGGQTPEMIAAPHINPSISDAVTGSKMAVGDAIQGAKGTAQDIIDNAAVRPGGFQAGSVGIPKEPQFTNGATAIDNPNPYPFTEKPGTFDKLGHGQNNDVRQIRFTGDKKAPILEQNANETLDRLGIKGDAGQQMTQIETKAKPAIYQWIKNESSMATQPKQIPISDLKDAITAEVKNQFGRGAPEGKTLDQVINQHLNDVYDRAGQEMQDPNPTMNQAYFPKSSVPAGSSEYTPAAGLSEPARYGYNGPVTAPSVGVVGKGELPIGSIEPKTINSQSIYNMKVAANNTPEVSSAFDKIRNGQAATLTDEEKIALAGRNAYDKVLAKAHPDVKQATQDLSTLNNRHVYQSLEKARFSPPPLPQVIPKEIFGTTTGGLNKVLVKGGSAALRSPTVRTAGLMTAGAGALGASEYGLKAFNQDKGNAENGPIDGSSGTPSKHTQSISNDSTDVNGQSVSGVNSAPGRYSVDSPQTQGLAMDANKYKSAVQQIEGIINQEKLNNPQQAAIDQGKLDQLNTQWSTQQPIVTAYTNYNTLAGMGHTAYQEAQAAAPGLLNLNGSFDSLMKSTDPKYAQLAGTLQYLQKTTGVDLAHAKNKETLLKSIDAAMNIAKTQYQAVLQPYIGGNTLNPGTTTVNIPQAQPVPNTPDNSQIGAPVDYHNTINGNSPQFSNGSSAF